MKYGEVFGAVSRELNRGKMRINLRTLESSVEADEDDVEAAMVRLWENGLVRKINNEEFELICDVSQLREFILKDHRELDESKKDGEYSNEGDKPLTLEEIKNTKWELDKKSIKKETSTFDSLFGRKSDFDPFSDGDEEEKKESVQQIREKVKGFLREMSAYDEETQSFEPDLGIVFPGSDTRLVLEWQSDEDGDLYLTDKGCFYDYLLNKMPNKENLCTLDLIDMLLTGLEKKTAFVKMEHKLGNYLTGVETRDSLRSEVNYYVYQLGGYIQELSWLLDPKLNEKSIEEKLEEFAESYSWDQKLSLSELLSAGARGRVYLRQILSVDPRMTRHEALRAARRIRERMIIGQVPDHYIRGIDETIEQLDGKLDRTFNMLKSTFFSKPKE